MLRCIPGVQVSVGHVLPGLGGDVSDGVDLLLGVINNKVVITPVIRESEITSHEENCYPKD